MKSIKIFAAVLALTSASFAATAADSVTTATGDLQSMGLYFRFWCDQPGFFGSETGR